MSKQKILVTGADGLVGSRFVEMSRNYTFLTPDLHEMDLTSEESVRKYIEKENPDWIVNFAAFTDVNASETQKGDKNGLAWKVNVEGVENLLKFFKSKNFIQISTDMVFPGDLIQPGPYEESDPPSESPEKSTWYGWTKKRGEKIARSHGATILRIIYPVRASFDNKLDYIRGVLKKYSEGKLYPLFSDQQISISFIDEIAETLQKIIETEARGIFHASSDTTTPYDLISYVFDQLGLDSSVIKSTSINEFLKTQNNPNRYPVWGGLKTKKTEEKLDIHFSTWQTIVEILVAQGLSVPEA